MRITRNACILLLIGSFFITGMAYAETIYTRDGQRIKGKITEITEDTVWIEITKGDLTEEIGIEISNIKKIVNDDGRVSTVLKDKEKQDKKNE